MKQGCVLKMIISVSKNSAQRRMKQRFVLNLITRVSNITCKESNEAALCTELDLQRQQYNVH
jgi:hypothetical protein